MFGWFGEFLAWRREKRAQRERELVQRVQGRAESRGTPISSWCAEEIISAVRSHDNEGIR